MFSGSYCFKISVLLTFQKVLFSVAMLLIELQSEYEKKKSVKTHAWSSEEQGSILARHLHSGR